MQMEKVRIIVLIGSLLGIIALYGYSLQLQPIEVRLSELGDHNESYVITSGHVIELSPANKDMQMRLRDDNATAVVFFEGNERSELFVGDRVEVIGKVFSYNQGHAISISGKNSIRLLQRWDSSIVTLPAVAQDPWAFLDRNLNLSCRIRIPLSDRDGYSYAVVEDMVLTNYSIPVFVYGIDVQRLYTGARAFMNARFEYHATGLSFSFIIDSPDHHFWLDLSNDTSVDRRT